MVCSAGVCTPTHKSAVLNAGDLQTLLASGNVTVTTGSGSLAAETSDIDVNAPLQLEQHQHADASTPTIPSRFSKATLGRWSGRPCHSSPMTAAREERSPSATAGRASFATVSSSLTINGAAYTLGEATSRRSPATSPPIPSRRLSRWSATDDAVGATARTHQSPIPHDLQRATLKGTRQHAFPEPHCYPRRAVASLDDVGLFSETQAPRVPAVQSHSSI